MKTAYLTKYNITIKDLEWGLCSFYWNCGLEERQGAQFLNAVIKVECGIASSDKFDGYLVGFLGIVSYNKNGRNTKPSRHCCRHSPIVSF